MTQHGAVPHPTRPELHPDPAYAVPPPDAAPPIVLIGAGGIVRDAHLPAYRKAGWAVTGIVNRTRPRAEMLAREFDVPSVWTSVPEAVAAAPADTVWDLALMPQQYTAALEALPDGAAVLIQKPLGDHLVETDAIIEVCERKGLVAAVNTQLRFAPYVAAARAAIAAERIGELVDLEVVVEVRTPWERFPNVLGLERLEINAHSVHYLDLVRSFVGEPHRVSASTVGRPSSTLPNTRSAIVLHYDDRPLRALVSTNHDHRFGPRHEQSFIKWEGVDGAVRVQLGLLLDYPDGGEDRAEIWTEGAGWQPLPFEGSWFPDAFVGSMGALLSYLDGSTPSLPTSVRDVRRTMQLVEAAYEADRAGGVRPEAAASTTTAGGS